ncbi:MAG: SDR family oxidoreductase [Bryobacteraceae bacterium]|jgi:NAD(P)-dependent dehydrogenase (short-subunit alcohol dehydrogenase family)
MNLQLEGKLALVTGSTAGIGFAIAKRLAAEGARVVVNGRTEARVTAACEAIRREYPAARLDGFVGDLSVAEESLAICARFPSPEILVNNLGTYEVKPFEQITDADWHAIIETNFMSGVRLSRCFLPKMKAAGWGRIIFISSESAVNIPVEMVHYGVTKTMQLALSRGLAELTSGTGVTVNSILPGPTRSEGVEKFVQDVATSRQIAVADFEKEFFRTIRPSSIIQRFATPDEVAALVVFVASPLSSATNGAALHVDGGTVRSIL